MHPDIIEQIRARGIRRTAEDSGVPESSIRSMMDGITAGAAHVEALSKAIGCSTLDIEAGQRVLMVRTRGDACNWEIRARLAPGVRYRAEASIRLRGARKWRSIGRIEATSMQGLVAALKVSARATEVGKEWVAK